MSPTNKAKPKQRQNKILLINATREYAKGDPKNFVPETGIRRIAECFIHWREQSAFSIVARTPEIVANDYNISPTRYIQTTTSVELRPLAEIVTELNQIEDDACKTNRILHAILASIDF